MPESPRQSRLLVLAAALLFSNGGAAIKAASLNGWQIASMRSGIAALFLFAAIPESRQRSLRLVPVAACYAATLISFVLANRLTTAAHAIFLQSQANEHESVCQSADCGNDIAAGGIGCCRGGRRRAHEQATDPDNYHPYRDQIAPGVDISGIDARPQVPCDDPGIPRGDLFRSGVSFASCGMTPSLSWR
jgi:hypothetical protein